MHCLKAEQDVLTFHSRAGMKASGIKLCSSRNPKISCHLLFVPSCQAGHTTTVMQVSETRTVGVGDTPLKIQDVHESIHQHLQHKVSTPLLKGNPPTQLLFPESHKAFQQQQCTVKTTTQQDNTGAASLSITPTQTASSILLNPALDDGLHHTQPVSVRGDGPQVNGSVLQAVQLVQAALDGNVPNKVEHVLILGGLLLVKLK
ncbi:hypothetical protein E2C01_006035 [Portunus trituberculatus]|uniref:Uncharacterized protein n=1 Tax=Portunus trituberculatus TaxID=210409 RepID=A0A5B7CX25_PORTR|nr:hypothetical protein [Portunus trituberculatus]